MNRLLVGKHIQVAVHYGFLPLERLVRLHQSYHEMSTGLVYRSPFERADARFR